jgi:hypothetical protein
VTRGLTGAPAGAPRHRSSGRGFVDVVNALEVSEIEVLRGAALDECRRLVDLGKAELVGRRRVRRREEIAPLPAVVAAQGRAVGRRPLRAPRVAAARVGPTRRSEDGFRDSPEEEERTHMPPRRGVDLRDV